VLQERLGARIQGPVESAGEQGNGRVKNGLRMNQGAGTD